MIERPPSPLQAGREATVKGKVLEVAPHGDTTFLVTLRVIAPKGSEKWIARVVWDTGKTEEDNFLEEETKPGSLMDLVDNYVEGSKAINFKCRVSQVLPEVREADLVGIRWWGTQR